MIISTEVIGVSEVLKNIDKAKLKISLAVGRGLKKAGLLLQRESQLKVPVDFGVLKASAFTRSTGSGLATVVNVGYTAAYAIYVHENVEMKGKGQPRQKPSKGLYWDPQGRATAKFLEIPFKEFAPTLNKVVAIEIKGII